LIDTYPSLTGRDRQFRVRQALIETVCGTQGQSDRVIWPRRRPQAGFRRERSLALHPIHSGRAGL